MSPSILRTMRERARLTQSELAERANTSRTAIAAYESGAKSPTFRTAERICAAAGFRLSVDPVQPRFEVRGAYRGRPVEVPVDWPRLTVAQALRRSVLPLHLEWSSRREYDLADRYDRRLVYALVLQEGSAADVIEWVDPALLVDLWPSLVLPKAIRRIWSQVLSEWGVECSDRSSAA